MVLANPKIVRFGASYVYTTDGGSHIELQAFSYAFAVIIWNTLRPSETRDPHMGDRDLRCEKVDVRLVRVGSAEIDSGRLHTGSTEEWPPDTR